MFALFRFDSFFSVWYWVLTVFVWTLVCHRTLGVPHDMVLRARRLPDIADRVETLARITADRWAGLFDEAGALIAALVGFGLAALAGLGFWTGVEAAQALFLLLCPLVVVGIGQIRLARQVRAGHLGGVRLLKRLARRRAMNQAIAAVAMLLVAVAALGHPPPGFGF